MDDSFEPLSDLSGPDSGPDAAPAAVATPAAPGPANPQRYDAILSIPVTVQVVLGGTTMPVSSLMKLGRGAIVPTIAIDHSKDVRYRSPLTGQRDHPVGPSELEAHKRLLAGSISTHDDVLVLVISTVLQATYPPCQGPANRINKGGLAHAVRTRDDDGVRVQGHYDAGAESPECLSFNGNEPNAHGMSTWPDLEKLSVAAAMVAGSTPS